MFYNYLIFNMVTLSLRILLKYCVSLYKTKHIETYFIKKRGLPKQGKVLLMHSFLMANGD